MHLDIPVCHELSATHDVSNVLVVGEDFNGIPQRSEAFAVYSFFLWLRTSGPAAGLESYREKLGQHWVENSVEWSGNM